MNERERSALFDQMASLSREELERLEKEARARLNPLELLILDLVQASFDVGRFYQSHGKVGALEVAGALEELASCAVERLNSAFDEKLVEVAQKEPQELLDFISEAQCAQVAEELTNVRNN